MLLLLYKFIQGYENFRFRLLLNFKAAQQTA